MRRRVVEMAQAFIAIRRLTDERSAYGYAFAQPRVCVISAYSCVGELRRACG